VRAKKSLPEQPLVLSRYRLDSALPLVAEPAHHLCGKRLELLVQLTPLGWVEFDKVSRLYRLEHAFHLLKRGLLLDPFRLMANQRVKTVPDAWVLSFFQGAVIPRFGQKLISLGNWTVPLMIDHKGQEIRYGDQFVSTDNMTLSSLHLHLAHAMLKMESYYAHENSNEQLVQLGHEYALATQQLEKLSSLVHHELESYDRIVTESITLAEDCWQCEFMWVRASVLQCLWGFLYPMAGLVCTIVMQLWGIWVCGFC